MNQAIFLKKPLPLLRTTPRIVPRLPLCRTVRAVSKEHAHLVGLFAIFASTHFFLAHSTETSFRYCDERFHETLRVH